MSLQMGWPEMSATLPRQVRAFRSARGASWQARRRRGNFAPKQPDFVKFYIFRVPLRVAGSGTETCIEIFGYDPTSKSLRTPHGLCGKFVSVCVEICYR